MKHRLRRACLFPYVVAIPADKILLARIEPNQHFFSNHHAFNAYRLNYGLQFCLFHLATVT
jgi:hypothetical protein